MKKTLIAAIGIIAAAGYSYQATQGREYEFLVLSYNKQCTGFETSIYSSQPLNYAFMIASNNNYMAFAYPGEKIPIIGEQAAVTVISKINGSLLTSQKTLENCIKEE